MPSSVKKKKRYGRDEWLRCAADIIASEGGAHISIDNLCAKLGVTKGSFYAHFADRKDFVGQFVQRWSQLSTQSVINEINKLRDEPAEARLLALMKYLRGLKTKRVEVALRAWATNDSVIAKGIRKTDEKRYDYIRQIFHQMGFRGADLEVRTRIFVLYNSGSMSTRLPRSRLSGEEELKRRHAFFCRKP